ncbi:smalltalk protein, partial [Bacteroides intestinalis]
MAIKKSVWDMILKVVIAVSAGYFIRLSRPIQRYS